MPPTSASAKYHSLPLYYQVQEWIGWKTPLQPTDWGWTLTNNRLMPFKTDLSPAPESLLNMIKCACRINCDTMRCTCRKNGLECTSGCQNAVVSAVTTPATVLIWTWSPIQTLNEVQLCIFV